MDLQLWIEEIWCQNSFGSKTIKNLHLEKLYVFAYFVKLLKAWMASTQPDPGIHNGPTQWPVAVVPARGEHTASPDGELAPAVNFGGYDDDVFPHLSVISPQVHSWDLGILDYFNSATENLPVDFAVCCGGRSAFASGLASAQPDFKHEPLGGFSQKDAFFSCFPSTGLPPILSMNHFL